ncbi:MAG: hypothetical protein EPO20_06540 [Betaproteobacteria bacterium]|nr:MAG: hypothetical protein EPO20_06540 [Betaproteobacteria bacterium]
MRLIALIEYAAVIIGVVGVIAGKFFALHKGFEFGVFMIGAGIALGGIEGLATRRMAFRTSDDAYEVYAGAPAIIVALMALLVGAATIAAAYLLNDGLWHSTVNDLTRRPAPLLIGAGLLVTGIGALMMLNPQARRGWAWMLFIYVPRWLVGLILVTAGLAGIALGVWEWLDPQKFDRLVSLLPSAGDATRAVRRLYRPG